MAAPATAAPIYSLSEANPLMLLAISQPEVDERTVFAQRDEPELPGPRRDVQPPYLGWPALGALQSPFGFRWGKVHEGLDIDGETGDLVVAAERGEVVFAEYDQGYGLTVEIAHSGRFEGLVTRYSHLSSALVEPGQFVLRGEELGRIGTTGHVTGSHLHFELHDAEGPFDPADLLVSLDDES